MTENITDSHVVRRLERSTSDRMLAGVCGGLGRYFELNSTVFRVGFVVLTLLGGAGVLVYLAAVLVMPGGRRERSVAEQVLAERKERPWPLVGLGIGGPDGARVQVNARAKLGDVHVLRLEDSGRNAIVTTGSRGRYVIDARVGLGRIDVVRAG